MSIREFNDITQNIRTVNLESIFIQRDLLNWNEELAIATVEMQFCYNLFDAIVKDTNQKDWFKYDNIFTKLKFLQKSNASFQTELIKLANHFEGYLECEDMQCDNYYMSSHLDFRDKIEKHFSQYRKLKKKLLTKIYKQKD